jgi:hypothetical protein
MRKTRTLLVLLAVSSFGAAALAQESASHKLEEHTFNAGGHPAGGVNPASASHQITLGSIGDPFASQLSFGDSNVVASSFLLAYPPPGEVGGLLFVDNVALVWDASAASGTYSLYRGLIGSLSGLGFGACLQQNIPAATTTDATLPVVGEGFFYLVTVENLLGEEGTKGFTSGGAERLGSACP